MQRALLERCLDDVRTVLQLLQLLLLTGMVMLLLLGRLHLVHLQRGRPVARVRRRRVVPSKRWG